MLVTVDTGDIDLVHNTEVLEAALNELPFGWIAELEFFREDTISFIKTYDDWYITSDLEFQCGSASDLITIVQGDNPLGKEAMSVSFHEPLSKDITQRQNEVLQKVMSIKDGETLLDGRFVKYQDFFLDADNDLNHVGVLAVANKLFLEKYSDDHDFMKLFTKQEGCHPGNGQ